MRQSWAICVAKQILTLCSETESIYMVIDKAPPSLLALPSAVKLGHLCGKTDINSVWWNRVGVYYVSEYMYMMVVVEAPSILLVFPSMVKLGHLCGKTDVNSMWRNRVGVYIFPSVVKLGHLYGKTDINSVSWNRVDLYVNTCMYIYICIYMYGCLRVCTSVYVYMRICWWG